MSALGVTEPIMTADEITAAVDEIAMIESAIAASRKRLGEVEMAVRTSLGAENATRFPHPRYDVTLKPGRKVYDLDKVRAALGEKLPPDVIDKLAPTEPVECKDCEGRGVVSPKVSGTEANKVRRYGDEYAALLDLCIATQADSELVIEPKPKKGAIA